MGYSLDRFQPLVPCKREFGPESVFEVDCSCSAQYGGSQYAEVQGVRNQFGWGFFTPSQALEDAFEPGDIRKQFTILREGQTTPEGDLIKRRSFLWIHITIRLTFLRQIRMQHVARICTKYQSIKIC